MIKCKHNCFSEGKNICCTQCPERDICIDVCTYLPTECLDAVFEEDECNNTELITFESKSIAIMQSIADLHKQKEEIEIKDAEMRMQLEAVMDEYGIQNFENDLLRITHVAPTTRETFDTKKFKADCPEIAAKYTKTSKVKGFVRIQVK